WIILFLAGLFEIAWAVGLKYTEGFTRLVPSGLTIAAMAISVGLLGLAMKSLPLGTAYAIWTGIGAVGTVIAGIILFGESVSLFRLGSVLLIFAGIIGLRLSHRVAEPHFSRLGRRNPPAEQPLSEALQKLRHRMEDPAGHQHIEQGYDQEQLRDRQPGHRQQQNGKNRRHHHKQRI